MKADPDAQQQLQGIYKLEEADGRNSMALQIDYENMEGSLRSMLHHNGQPTFNEKEDTTRQMHAYKNAISKFRNHINYVERENHALKSQIASLATQTMNGDSVTQHQRPGFVSTQGGISQLEDIRVTCAMLSERIKRMEEQNNILLMNAEKQRCDYERCLDRVASQVFQTLSYQRRLQMECDALRIQVHHLTGTSPHSLPGSSRSSESSPNGQLTHGSAPDDVFSQYGGFAHVPYNVVAGGYIDANQAPYSPNFSTRGEGSPGATNLSTANQKLPVSAACERRGQYYNYNPQYQPLVRDHVQFNGNAVDSQYERQALSPHRIQTAKTPPLHAIPESVEPVSVSVQDLTHFRPRLPRSGSGMIAGPPSLGSKRTACDDEIVGRISRSRDRQRPAERNKVGRSRSFDGHSAYHRTPPTKEHRSASPQRLCKFSPPSYRPGPPLLSVPVGHVDQSPTQKLRTDSLAPQQTSPGPNIYSVKSGECVQPDPAVLPGDSQIAVTKVAKTSPGTVTSNLPTSSGPTDSVSSLLAQQPLMTGSQELKSPTVRENHDLPFSREGLQRSFRVTRSCERREQRKAVDDVWLPRSGGPSEPTNNRFISSYKDSCNSSLPPPPPPPPDDQAVEENTTDIDRSNAGFTEVCGKELNSCHSDNYNENIVTVRQKSQSMDQLSDKSMNDGTIDISISKSNYATVDAHPRQDSAPDDKIMDKVTAPLPTTEKDDEPKSPQKSPTQLQPPKLVSLKKSTKREAPKPPTVTPPSAFSKSAANLVRKDGMSPSVSCEALSSSTNNDKDKNAPRRLSEGMVKEQGKKSRLAAPSQKTRIKERQKPVADIQTENSSSAAMGTPSPAELSVKNRSPKSTRLQTQTKSGPKVASEQKTNYCASDASEPRMKSINEAQARRENRDIKGTKSTPDNKSPKGRSSSGGDSKSCVKDEARIEKKTETKKKSGNQKSFVGMMKSKFGGKGLGNKKTVEVQSGLESTMQEETKPTSVIDPRTLSLEPNSFPPENVGKRSSKKTNHDPVGRKLSRPFLDVNVDGYTPPTTGFSVSEAENSNRKGFLGRNNSKRSKFSRQGALQNGDHFNNVPYGRVELIPIGAPIPGAIEYDQSENNPGFAEVVAGRQKEITGTSLDSSLSGEVISNMNKAGEDSSPTRRQMNDYENVIILNDLHKRNALPSGVASHSYENVVIVKTVEKSCDVKPDAKQMDVADEETVVGETVSKQLTPKQPSPLQKLWTSFSNHSLNKLSGSESGSRTALQDVGKGRCAPGQPNSEKTGGSFISEQQMFEKAFISSVVEAELNSKEKRDTNVAEIGDGGYLQKVADNNEETREMNGNYELTRSHQSIQDCFSQEESRKSSIAFDATESLKSSNSGFDSWPTKSTGPSSPRVESARSGSLDARFRDVKSIQDLEIGGQSFLQKRSIVDSRSSLGSYGYGSGVSGSSTTSSNKSRGLSPPRRSCEATNTRDFSSSDNDLASTPQPSTLQSRYAVRRFASPVGGATQGNRLPKHQGLPKPKASMSARVKMGVSSISPPKSHNVAESDGCILAENEEPPKKLAPLSCNSNSPHIAEKPTSPQETGNAKNKEPRRSGLPTRAASGSSRFGVQRTSIPVRHSGSRMQQHAG